MKSTRRSSGCNHFRPFRPRGLYEAGQQVPGAQDRSTTYALLAGQYQKGSSPDRLPFFTVHYDCCATSQPAACAKYAHMEYRHSTYDGAVQIDNNRPPAFRGDST